MFEDFHTLSMHEYFNVILRMRQDLRHRVQQKLAENGYHDVTLEMLQVLYYIYYITPAKKSNQQDIANRTGRNKASITSLVENLVRRGLINRETDPASRRSNIITLTREGKGLVDKIYDKVYKTYDFDKAGITIEEINAATALISKIITNS